MLSFYPDKVKYSKKKKTEKLTTFVSHHKVMKKMYNFNLW